MRGSNRRPITADRPRWARALGALVDRTTASVGMVGLLVAYVIARCAESPWPFVGFVLLFGTFLVARTLMELVPGLHAWMRLHFNGTAQILAGFAGVIFGAIAILGGVGPSRPAVPQPPASMPTVRRDD